MWSEDFLLSHPIEKNRITDGMVEFADSCLTDTSGTWCRSKAD